MCANWSDRLTAPLNRPAAALNSCHFLALACATPGCNAPPQPPHAATAERPVLLPLFMCQKGWLSTEDVDTVHLRAANPFSVWGSEAGGCPSGSTKFV